MIMVQESQSDSQATRDSDFGERLVRALERFGASLEALPWSQTAPFSGGTQCPDGARPGSIQSSIRRTDRMGLLALLKARHQVVPADLESAIRSQAPEALAFRLAGDPRLMRAVQLLSLSA